MKEATPGWRTVWASVPLWYRSLVFASRPGDTDRGNAGTDLQAERGCFVVVERCSLSLFLAGELADQAESWSNNRRNLGMRPAV
jgi:hypothetical protein